MPKKRKLAAKHAANPRRHHPDAPKPPATASKNHPPPGKPGFGKKKVHKQTTQSLPTIPFSPHERILLLGEGDLSYAASLVKHHGCNNVIATVFEKNEVELLEKYPHARENLDVISAELVGDLDEDRGEDVNWEEDYGSDWDDDDDVDKDGDHGRNGRKGRDNFSRVVYGVDATKPFPASISKPPPKRIIFNFPHTGGLSTDVNRQVRANQSLLVSFFESALKTLAATPYNPRTLANKVEKKEGVAPSITVTLFEAEPYTLWNIRDLGRHCGLQVERSFKFQPDAYPGYRHARTCGVIRGKDGQEAGWRGEERSSRSYVFVRKEEEQDMRKGTGANRGDEGPKKRKKEKDSDDESD